jgi:hypothetical protein
MRYPVAIEDIENLRLREGIEDVELRVAIRGLRVGDFVKLTFQSGTTPCVSETLPVRVITIRGSKYRGKLVTGPKSTALSRLRPRSIVTFAAAHIHSMALESAARHRRTGAHLAGMTVHKGSQK